MPDPLACTELNMSKGWCTRMIANEEFYVDDERPYTFENGESKTWWELRPFMVMIPFPSFAELKAYLIKNCKAQNCDKYIQSWERKVNKLDDKSKNE